MAKYTENIAQKHVGKPSLYKIVVVTILYRRNTVEYLKIPKNAEKGQEGYEKM